MTARKKDPLLLAAKIVVGIANALVAFSGVMVTIGLVAVLTVARDEFSGALAEANVPEVGYWALAGGFALIVAVLAILAVFLRILFNIIRSVDQGDPFQPANADRLAKMGWLTVAGHLLTVPLGALTAWVSQFEFGSGEEFDLDVGFGPGGIVLTLVLFVLARVFRQGAAMRDDLEGTV